MDHRNEMLCILAAICCSAAGGFATRAVDMAEAIIAEVEKRHPPTIEVNGEIFAR